jgi:uncharacterized integral membrane protein
MSDASQSGQRSQAHARGRQRTSAELVRLGLTAVTAALVLVFIALNTQQVSVDWIVTTTKTPFIVVILISLVVGGTLVAAAFARRRRSADRRRRAARAERWILWIMRAGASGFARRSDCPGSAHNAVRPQPMS